jgi:hypothetical protein
MFIELPCFTWLNVQVTAPPGEERQGSEQPGKQNGREKQKITGQPAHDELVLTSMV